MNKEITEIANAMVNECRQAPCLKCMWCDQAVFAHAEALYNAGYRKQEWISVEERLPETKLETITVEDVKIGSGGQSIPCGTKEQFSSQVSELVAIVSNHPKGVYIDIDRMIDGAWSNNWYVTHWMPLPEAPKMKGDSDE